MPVWGKGFIVDLYYFIVRVIVATNGSYLLLDLFLVAMPPSRKCGGFCFYPASERTGKYGKLNKLKKNEKVTNPALIL